MRRSVVLTVILLIIHGVMVYGQPVDVRGFKMAGINPAKLTIDKSFNSTSYLDLSGLINTRINGLSISADIRLDGPESNVRFILQDNDYLEYMVYEMYDLLASGATVSVKDLAEETVLLDDIRPGLLRIEISDATVVLRDISYVRSDSPGLKSAISRNELDNLRHEEKIRQLNQSILKKGQLWAAGRTEISDLTYSEKKALFGESTFPPGFEYYCGGIVETSPMLKSASVDRMIEKWDWRDRHGKNWLTPVKNQGSCGSCWAFAATGATEALVNLFYNQLINLDLSEQHLLSCSGAGTCNGGYPSTALDFIAKTGIIDEQAFPYKASDISCNNKSSLPAQQIKIAGKVDFGTSQWPTTEESLKKMIIRYGPVSGGVYDWLHAMTLVGWQVVREGDRFYVRDSKKNTYWITIAADNPLIGTTVWIFKNSWGNWGDGGYVYVQTPITNIAWTHALQNPVQSLKQNFEVVCEDKDGDGYYWWGLGPKPAHCDCPDTPDGNDNDPTLGPLDEFGHCIILSAPPVADFSSDITSAPAKGMISFSDISKNNPTSWLWNFPGGSPSSSTSKNPVVTYPDQGSYSVTLTVTNANGSSQVTKENYVTITEPQYCQSSGTVYEEWISSVVIGDNNYSSGKSGTNGYQDLTQVVFTVINGTTNNINLTPGFSGKAKNGFWRIWIDFNGDKDFDDPGELVYSSSKSSSQVNGTINIPAGLNISTRMRVSLKRNSLPNACEIFSQGEVEDYTINIIPIQPKSISANFTSNVQETQAGNSVRFTDMSTGSPTSWNWIFEGGNPAVSSEQNPIISYDKPGTYNVSLRISKEGVADSEITRNGFITVVDPVVTDYCIPTQVNSRDFIKSVAFGNMTYTSAGSGYSIQNTEPINFTNGQRYSVKLEPGNTSNRYFWRIWLDLNNDGDFNDPGETLLSIDNRKGSVNANITIPATDTNLSRMRITMRADAAPSPCDDGFSGEVEDYQVSLSPQVSIRKTASGTLEGAFSANDLKIYPNPAKDKISIQSDFVYPGDSYTVYNAEGMSILKGIITENLSTVSIGHLSTGIYLVVVQNGDTLFREKIIKL
jgi:PKD repeat protein